MKPPVRKVQPLLLWGRHYRLGIEAIDSQHEEITVLINALYAAFRSEAPRPETGAALDRLIRAVARHFRTEEKLMQGTAYPGLEPHAAEHSRLAKRVRAFQKEFRAGRAELTDALIRSLADWLRDHLLVSDNRLGKHLAGREGGTALTGC
jgi:hemerythrin-like metal-binding protein